MRTIAPSRQLRPRSDHALDAVEQAASVGPRAVDSSSARFLPWCRRSSAMDDTQSEAMRDIGAVAGRRWQGGAVRLLARGRTGRDRELRAAASSRSLTRGGYSQRLHQELAIALVRRIRAARGRPAKVVALDCDNTLWGGVVGEVGLEGLELGPGRCRQELPAVPAVPQAPEGSRPAARRREQERGARRARRVRTTSRDGPQQSTTSPRGG